MTNIVAIIPARYKSSRFPGKPLVEIEGKPLIWWVYQNVMKVKEFTEVLVATDDDRIHNACEDCGLSVIMTSDQHATGTDRVAEVASQIKADLYINVQGDEPLLQPDTIKEAILPFLTEDSGIQVTNLMTEIKRSEDIINSTVPKVAASDDGNAIFLSRSPIPYPKANTTIKYMKQVCVYGFTPVALQMFASTKRGNLERAEDIELLRFIENGYKIQMIEVEQDTVAVDTPSDLEIVREIIRKKKQSN